MVNKNKTEGKTSTDGVGVTETQKIKIYNSVGCSIDGVSETEFEKFKKVGWMTEEEYLKQEKDL